MSEKRYPINPKFKRLVNTSISMMEQKIFNADDWKIQREYENCLFERFKHRSSKSHQRRRRNTYSGPWTHLMSHEDLVARNLRPKKSVRFALDNKCGKKRKPLPWFIFVIVLLFFLFLFSFLIFGKNGNK